MLKSQGDTAKDDALTDADIEADARSDPDWNGLLDIDWSKAEITGPKHPKQMISLRLDPDVLDFFRSLGPGYQTRINAVLRYYVNEARRKAAG